MKNECKTDLMLIVPGNRFKLKRKREKKREREGQMEEVGVGLRRC